MKNKLEEINGVNGVRTSFIYFNDGEIVYDSMPSGFDSDIFQEIAKDAVQMAAIFDRLTASISEYDLKYDNGRVFIYTQHNYNLIILCDLNVSVAMLRLTVNVALADLEADKKFQKRAAKVETTRRSFLIRSNMDADSWTLAEKVN
jgi:predicted regulator of Ras-like GTPase activity (Roadblock/LC7/MglB family)